MARLLSEPNQNQYKACTNISLPEIKKQETYELHSETRKSSNIPVFILARQYSCYVGSSRNVQLAFVCKCCTYLLAIQLYFESALVFCNIQRKAGPDAPANSAVEPQAASHVSSVLNNPFVVTDAVSFPRIHQSMKTTTWSAATRLLYFKGRSIQQHSRHVNKPISFAILSGLGGFSASLRCAATNTKSAPYRNAARARSPVY